MNPPRVFVEADLAAVSQRAAALIDAAIRDQPSIVLALPTGATPIGTYAALDELHRRSGTDWSQAVSFNLDEYLGVGPEHPESYAYFMRQHLFEKVIFSPERRHLPDALAPDPATEAARYEALIDAAGGLDLAVLGVGTNGHLGFNEPGDSLVAATHVATLSEESWARNFPALARANVQALRCQFRRAYTMGIGTILRSRRILLLASGVSKRAVLRSAFDGPITTYNPASFLQLHRDVTLVVDAAAWTP